MLLGRDISKNKNILLKIIMSGICERTNNFLNCHDSWIVNTEKWHAQNLGKLPQKAKLGVFVPG